MPVIPPWLDGAIRRCPACGLGVAESRFARWPEARHLARVSLAIARLLIATAMLIGMSVANAALARTIARSLAFTVPGERLAATIVIATAAVTTGGMTAALLAHRRSRVAGATIAVGTLGAAAYLAVAVPADLPSRTDSLLCAGVLAAAAFLATPPAAAVLRFIGRFEHLLPWSAR